MKTFPKKIFETQGVVVILIATLLLINCTPKISEDHTQEFEIYNPDFNMLNFFTTSDISSGKVVDTSQLIRINPKNFPENGMIVLPVLESEIKPVKIPYIKTCPISKSCIEEYDTMVVTKVTYCRHFCLPDLNRTEVKDEILFKSSKLSINTSGLSKVSFSKLGITPFICVDVVSSENTFYPTYDCWEIGYVREGRIKRFSPCGGCASCTVWNVQFISGNQIYQLPSSYSPTGRVISKNETTCDLNPIVPGSEPIIPQ